LFGPEGVNCRMMQSERNRRITLRWEKVMQLDSSQDCKSVEKISAENSSLRDSMSHKARAVLYDNVVGCKIMHRARFWRAASQSLCAVVRL